MAAAPARLGGREWGLAGIAALLGAVVTVIVLAVAGAFEGNARPVVSHLTPVGDDTTDVATIVEQAAPSVLSIHVVSAGFMEASGSGVAIGRKQVLTSATLVNGASPVVTVATPDGRVLEGMVAGVDTDTDLALVIVQLDGGRDLTPAALGAADSLVVGQTVVAMGRTSGDPWASPGVVSALGQLATSASGAAMAGLVQTDVSPGDAIGGGALLDASGEVVGILTRAAPGNALPIEVARDVADQLETSGRARHGWLGLEVTDAGDRPGGGARVTVVTTGGPAEHAGIQVGDVITVVGADRISDAADLAAAISRRRANDPVGVTLWRADKRVRKDVDLGDRTDTTPAATS